MEDLCRKEIDQSETSLLQAFEIHFSKSTIFCFVTVCHCWAGTEKQENKASDWFSQMDKNQSNNDPPKK